MAEFLASIGIEMRAGVVDVPTIFPGSLIDHGSLVIDEDKLVAPGDALHEAAHIALVPVPRKSRRQPKLRTSALRAAIGQQSSGRSSKTSATRKFENFGHEGAAQLIQSSDQYARYFHSPHRA